MAKPRCHAEAIQITETTVAPTTFDTAMKHACSAVPVVNPANSMIEVKTLLWNGGYEGVSPHRRVHSRQVCRPSSHRRCVEGGRRSGCVGPHGLGCDREVAVWSATQRGESALAVVNCAGQFIGLISPHQMLSILLPEHEEDLARLGGFLRQTSIARIASEESIAWRFLHRLPWLPLGLAGAMVATDIVRAFEADLQKNVTLAFFVAGVVYLADAVGTQTETVVVRGPSVGISIRRVISRELLPGLAIVIVLAGISLPFCSSGGVIGGSPWLCPFRWPRLFDCDDRGYGSTVAL